MRGIECYQEVLILKNNIQWNVLRLDVCISWWLRERYRDHIPRMNLVIGLDGLVIDLDKAIVNPILNFGACYIGQTVHQKLVDP